MKDTKGAKDNNVLDFSSKRTEKINSTEKIKDLISQGKITTVFTLFAKTLPKKCSKIVL